MNRMVGGILILLVGLSVAAGEELGDKPATPTEQYEALVKEFYEGVRVFFEATTDEERIKAVARVDDLPRRILELAENNPNDPIALDALVQVVTQEIWLEINSAHPGRGKDSGEIRAIAILQRDHVRGEKLGEACRRMSYGFRVECETFLRTVLKVNPHRDVQALACLRLAQFLNGRLRRLDLVKEQPELVKRYEGLFGKDYFDALRLRDRVEAVKDAEAFFEQAAEKYGDVKVPYGGTVAEQATSELHEIRHLSIGKTAPEIEGQDQEGQPFKLSDYRGKVVLLYFWSEF